MELRLRILGSVCNACTWHHVCVCLLSSTYFTFAVHTISQSQCTIWNSQRLSPGEISKVRTRSLSIKTSPAQWWSADLSSSSRVSSISFPLCLLHPVLEPVRCGDVHVGGGVLNPFLYHMTTHTYTHTHTHAQNTKWTNVRSCHFWPPCATAGELWASTRQPPEVGAGTHRSTDYAFQLWCGPPAVPPVP